jgi:NhaP-type Na+/H+ or K+/H+ antiporter
METLVIIVALAVIGGLAALPIYTLIRMRSGRLVTQLQRVERSENPIAWRVNLVVAWVAAVGFGSMFLMLLAGFLMRLSA